MQNFTATWMRSHSGQCFLWKWFFPQSPCRRKQMAKHCTHRMLFLSAWNKWRMVIRCRFLLRKFKKHLRITCKEKWMGHKSLHWCLSSCPQTSSVLSSALLCCLWCPRWFPQLPCRLDCGLASASGRHKGKVGALVLAWEAADDLQSCSPHGGLLPSSTAHWAPVTIPPTVSLSARSGNDVLGWLVSGCLIIPCPYSDFARSWTFLPLNH